MALLVCFNVLDMYLTLLFCFISVSIDGMNELMR